MNVRYPTKADVPQLNAGGLTAKSANSDTKVLEELRTLAWQTGTPGKA
jgi:hypothetical protein